MDLKSEHNIAVVLEDLVIFFEVQGLGQAGVCFKRCLNPSTAPGDLFVEVGVSALCVHENNYN